MNPRRVSEPLVRETPLLRAEDSVEDAVRAVLDSDFPALPVVDSAGRATGIFGEREFMAAIFPGYVGQLRSASFVLRGLDDALQKRAACAAEPVRDHMNTEHTWVPSAASDLQVAETFLHHRVLIVPVCEQGRVTGVITRSDFFRGLAQRFLRHED